MLPNHMHPNDNNKTNNINEQTIGNLKTNYKHENDDNNNNNNNNVYIYIYIVYVVVLIH